MKTLNLDEAAKLLKVHKQSVLNMARSGKLPAAKPGKCWVFIDEDLFEWLRQNYTCNLPNTNQSLTGEKKCYLQEKRWKLVLQIYSQRTNCIQIY